MSNTTKITDTFLQIKGLDADWSIPGDLPGFTKSGILVRSITFHPSGASDAAVVKAGKATLTTEALTNATKTSAPEIFHVICAGDTDQRIKYFGEGGQRMWPFIEISDWNLSSAGAARLEFELV